MINFNTFHRAASIDTFHYLLNNYMTKQLNDLDVEVVEILTKKRNVGENKVEVIYPDYMFDSPITKGHKIASVDINSYEALKDYYFMECIHDDAMDLGNRFLEEHYIVNVSKNILTIETHTNVLLESLFNILSIKTTGILFGIIVNIKGKNYNLTHPAVLKLFLDSIKYFENLNSKCTLYVYMNEDENTCIYLKDLNRNSYKNKNSYDDDTTINKEEYLEIVKKSILFSCALVESKNTSAQTIDVSFEIPDLSSKDIYIDEISHYNHSPSIVSLSVNGFIEEGATLPKKESIIKVPYYIPIDILAKGVFVPFYGGAFVNASFNVVTGICNNTYEGMNVSPFISGNISSSQDITEFNTVCTGNLRNFDLNTMCSINYLNANSAFHHRTIPVGFLDIIECNIEIAYSILADYLGKDINESKDNKKGNSDTTQDSDTTQEGSSSELQQTSNRNISMEATMAKPNNPFERDISYSQRVSSSYVEPSVS